MIESGKKHLTKGSLRKYLLSSKDTHGLSRLDCHVLIMMLFNQNRKKVENEQNAEKRREMKQKIDKISVK